MNAIIDIDHDMLDSAIFWRLRHFTCADDVFDLHSS